MLGHRRWHIVGYSDEHRTQPEPICGTKCCSPLWWGEELPENLCGNCRRIAGITQFDGDLRP